jgi:hypothetical protein
MPARGFMPHFSQMTRFVLQYHLQQGSAKGSPGKKLWAPKVKELN